MKAISNATDPILEMAEARPFSARSLIGSVLLGIHPPRLRAQQLVRWCSLFGVADGTARVALTRMVERGELGLLDGVYELRGRVRERQREHDFALAPTLGPWNGTWLLAVVTADERTAADRSALREELCRQHFAEQREGVWTRPDNLVHTNISSDSRERDRQCRMWNAKPVDDAVELARVLFDLDGWATRAEALTGGLATTRDRLRGAGASAIPDAFYAGAAALAQLRSDPFLPPELLPSDWPAHDLAAAYLTYQPLFAATVRAWHHEQSSEHASTEE